MSRNELRDRVSALRRERDMHLMDENEYVDGVLALAEAYRAAGILHALERVEKLGMVGLDEEVWPGGTATLRTMFGDEIDAIRRELQSETPPAK